jgi:hypothetical protein
MDKNKFNYSKEETVYIAADDSYYSIRKFDWKRLKRLASKEQIKNVNLTIIYSILFGFAGSTGVSIIPLYYADNLPGWVTPIYIFISLICIGVAILLVILDKTIQKTQNADIDEIKIEMEEIEKLYIDKQEQLSPVISKIFIRNVEIDETWHLNPWKSNCAKRVQNQLVFEGNTAPKNGEDVAYIDLNNSLEINKTYEISCFAKSIEGSTCLVNLWCHDNTGAQNHGVNISTIYKTPSVKGEFIKLNFKAEMNNNIRIHLRYKTGNGRIKIRDVKIHELKI